MKMMTAAGVLERAADLIDRDGWTQHNYGGMDGPNCAAGALARIVGSLVSPIGLHHRPGSNPKLAIKAMNYLAEFIGGKNYVDIPNWNDADGRTAADVTSAMRAVAAILRAKESPAPPAFDLVSFARDAVVQADQLGRARCGVESE